MVLERLGWDGSARRRGAWVDVRCPFHSDAHASAGFKEADNIFVCQGCGMKGNSVTLVMLVNNMTAAQAVDWLQAQGPSRVSPPKGDGPTSFRRY